MFKLIVLSSGAPANFTLHNGTSALHIAAQHSSPAVTAVLLAAGADVEARRDNGVRPLHEAAGNGKFRVIEALVRAGADMHTLTDWGQTPIFYAAAEGRLRAVQELCRLAFTRYCHDRYCLVYVCLNKILFHFKALLWESISFYSPPPPCKAYPIAILLHDRVNPLATASFTW